MFEITSDARIWFQICLKLRFTHVFDFKWRRAQPCRWLSGTNNWVRAHVGDVIIVWHNTHNNTEPNAIWFPATLTDTDMNIQGIKVKYCTNGNSNIPATESRLWGTKWYYLFSAQVHMLRRGAFPNFLYNDFQLNVQELRLQVRFFKGHGVEYLLWVHNLITSFPLQLCHCHATCICRADSSFAPSQWETSLQRNSISHGH